MLVDSTIDLLPFGGLYVLLGKSCHADYNGLVLGFFSWHHLAIVSCFNSLREPKRSSMKMFLLEDRKRQAQEARLINVCMHAEVGEIILDRGHCL
jgi:hypothetical protein